MGGAKKGTMTCFVGQTETIHMVKSSWPSDFIVFLAEEITSLVRGPDFDPYESRERWDPLLSTVDGGRCDDSGEMSLQKKQNLNWRWTAGEIPGDGKWHM